MRLNVAGAAGATGPGLPAGKSLKTGTVAGPASYALGGFTLDLTAQFSSLDAVMLQVEAAGLLLPPSVVQVTLNKDASGATANGKCAAKLLAAANVEVAALTNLSTTTFRWLALGTGA